MSDTIERPTGDDAESVIEPARVEDSALGRLFEGQTAVDFVGRRPVGFAISSILLLATVVSLLVQGLNLGIDFEGGVSWDVPAEDFTIEQAEDILAANGVSTEGARLQERSSEQGDIVKVQVADQPEGVVAEVRSEFAEAAGVAPDDINVNLVSSSWGSAITEAAIEALVIFLVLVTLFISVRFEWRMAIAAIAAMVHDVLISVGIYSIFQFVVTPPTVIAFLTILGYSLYDTIVVFDRVKENEARFGAQRPPYDDIINVSMNQVLMRSLTTSFSSVVPVISLLFIGSGIMGQATLAEFALALLIGMVTGAYSSIFVAAPMLWLYKQFDASWNPSEGVTSFTGRIRPGGDRDQYAPFGQRVRGAVVEAVMVLPPILVGQLLLVAGLLLESTPALALGLLLNLALAVWLCVAYCDHVARTAQSWGGVVVGTYVVDARSGAPISAWRAFARLVLRLVSAVVLLLGFLWAIWDPRRQTWHDKLARTVVVRRSGGEQLVHERRHVPRATGDQLRMMVMTGVMVGKRQRRRGPASGDEAVVDDDAAEPSPSSGVSATTALSHPPRPRKKKRR